MTHEKPSLRKERKVLTPEKLLRILMSMYPEEIALDLFDQIVKGNKKDDKAD